MSGDDEGDFEGDEDSESSEIKSPASHKSMGNRREIDLEAHFMNANGIMVDEDQLAKEKAYVIPTDSEAKTKYKIQRLDVRQKFDAAQALLVNYVADDYRFLLKKMLNLLSIVPSTLKCLIIPLPKSCTYIDQYFAKRIQRMVASLPDLSMMILFVTHESHR